MKNKISAYALYSIARNFIIVRLLKPDIQKFLEGYDEWKKIENLKNIKLLSTGSKADIVPYVHAEKTLRCLELGGGVSYLRFLFTLYKLINLIERYLFKLLNLKKLSFVKKYSELRKKYPQIGYMEDLFIGTTAILLIGDDIQFNNKHQVYKIFLESDSLELEFNQYLNDKGVGEDSCEGTPRLMFRVVTDGNLTL